MNGAPRDVCQEARGELAPCAQVKPPRWGRMQVSKLDRFVEKSETCQEWKQAKVETVAVEGEEQTYYHFPSQDEAGNRHMLVCA